jgi:hypothetical protein
LSTPCRDELRTYAGKLHQLQIRCEKPEEPGDVRPLFGIFHLTDLRGHKDRAETDDGCEKK